MNIYVYSSTLFSGLIFEDEKLYRMMIPGTAWYVIRNRTGLLVSCYGKAHPCQGELKHTERGTQHCNNGRATPVCDPYRPGRKYSLVPVSNNYNYSLVIYEGSPPQFPWRPPFFIISPTTVPPRTSSSCCLSLFQEASYTDIAEVPVLRTPVEVAEVIWYVYHELPGMWYEIKQKQ